MNLVVALVLCKPGAAQSAERSHAAPESAIEWGEPDALRSAPVTAVAQDEEKLRVNLKQPELPAERLQAAREAEPAQEERVAAAR